MPASYSDGAAKKRRDILHYSWFSQYLQTNA